MGINEREDYGMNKQHITWHTKDIHLLELLTSIIILYNVFWFHKIEKNDSLKTFSKIQLNVNLIENTLFFKKKLNFRLFSLPLHIMKR
jgi:hypothetical protein